MIEQIGWAVPADHPLGVNNVFWEAYGPYIEQIAKPLVREFGMAFELQNTGGGCMALEAQTETGDLILITDAQDTLSPWHVRQQRWHNDREILGYLVGYYPHEDPTEAIAYVEYRKARDAEAVAIAVRAAMQLAQGVRAGHLEPTAQLVL